MHRNNLLSTVVRRAAKLTKEQKHNVIAVGFDSKKHILAITNNRRRFIKLGGGVHAELECVRIAGPNLRKIQLFRVNKSGGLLPIHPCKACQKVLDKLKIKVVPFTH